MSLHLLRHRKLLVFLCVWGFGGSAYFLWYSFLCQRHTLVRDTAPLPFSRLFPAPLHTITERMTSVPNPADQSRSAERKSTTPSSENCTAVNNDVAPSTNSTVSPESFHSVRSPAAATSVNDATKSPNSSMALPSSTRIPSSAAIQENLTNTPSPKLLCVHISGRLGNELFEYASTLALSLALNRTAVFLYSKHLHNVLKSFTASTASNLSFLQLEQRCNTARVMKEDSCCKFKVAMTRLESQYDYRLTQYLQSYRYFDTHQTEIRKAVAFNDRVRTQADRQVKELREKHKTSTLIGVHIRHGDMTSPDLQAMGYPLASPDYIQKSLSYFSDLFPNCVFVVGSDSAQWCIDNFPKRYSLSFLNNNEPAVDMLILASMDHVITSFGSFSWWIGYLNPGKTVYMKDFIRNNTIIGNAFNPEGKDYIYPGWIPL
ncbi:hypothetical protein ACOMHN_032142 [Nucella lapillus]